MLCMFSLTWQQYCLCSTCRTSASEQVCRLLMNVCLCACKEFVTTCSSSHSCMYTHVPLFFKHRLLRSVRSLVRSPTRQVLPRSPFEGGWNRVIWVMARGEATNLNTEHVHLFLLFFCFSDFFLSESHGWHELTVWNYIVWPVCRLWSVLPPANENISTVISTWPQYAVNVGKAAKSSLQSVLAIALSGHFLACQQLLSSVSLISCTASFSSSEWLHKLKHVETKAIHDFDYFVFSEQDIELQFQSSSENWWSPSLLLVSKGLHLPFPFFFVDVCPSITALPKLAKKCKE